MSALATAREKNGQKMGPQPFFGFFWSHGPCQQVFSFLFSMGHLAVDLLLHGGSLLFLFFPQKGKTPTANLFEWRRIPFASIHVEQPPPPPASHRRLFHYKSENFPNLYLGGEKGRDQERERESLVNLGRR